jgi:hypothetical protein
VIDNPFEMVVLIVLITAIAGVMRARYKRHGVGDGQVDSAETRQLREEVKVLKERLSVLERITVEKENSLAREIESLRDAAPSETDRR